MAKKPALTYMRVYAATLEFLFDEAAELHAADPSLDIIAMWSTIAKELGSKHASSKHR